MKIAPVQPDDVYDTEDGRRVVLIEQQVAVISAVAAVLLDVVAEGETDLDVVVGRLTEAFGEPPDGGDARRLTEDVVRDLAARGMLRVVSHK